MEQNIYKPKSLPQISAPFTYIAHNLNDMGIPYELVGVDVNVLNPSQGFVDSDLVHDLIGKLNRGEQLKAIFIDNDNDILDGHHRWVAYILNKNTHIPCARIKTNKDQTIAVLNEIQKQYDSENNSNFLNAIMEDEDPAMYTPKKPIETKKETVKAFRKKPIVEKSLSGNFFSLQELKGYKPYEIELDAVMNTDSIDPKIKKSKNPVAELLKVWYPSLNIQKKAEDWGMGVEDFINTIVAEHARTKKIDGILYGDKLLQTIDEK